MSSILIINSLVFWSADPLHTSVSMSTIPPIDLPHHISKVILTMAHPMVSHTTGDLTIIPTILHNPLQGMLTILTTTPLIHTITPTIIHRIIFRHHHILVGRTPISPLVMK